MTKQLALDLGDQDLGARGRRAQAGARATATGPTPLERVGRGSRPPKTKSKATSKTKSKATSKPAAPSGPTARRGADRATAESVLGTGRFPIVDEQWRLDEHTREIGLKGVAEVRRVLAALAVPDAA
ncbi:MAG TPA: hypothetical protein VKV06_02160 [Acidimicrobiales bacterium]|nr:hypothetical protein [Acidimicrobiales bacterium]